MKLQDINLNYDILAPEFPTPPAVYLQTTQFKDRYIFSCTSLSGHYESGKRVIVSLQRDGRWHCQSDGYATMCKHRPHAEVLAVEAGFVSERSSAVDRSDVQGGTVNSDADDVENAIMMKAMVKEQGSIRDTISN